MPFVPGIKRLSQLVVDAAKNWAGKRIDNVGAPDTDDDVPRARAVDILSGRFGMARMPDGASGLYLKAQGVGVDPAWAAAGGVWQKIATTTLGADTASVEFAGLAAAYNGFRLTIMARHNQSGFPEQRIQIRFNNDAGGNYAQQRASIYDATFAGALTYPVGYLDIGGIRWASVPQGVGICEAIIQNLNTVEGKKLFSHGGGQPSNNPYGAITLFYGYWTQTAKISTITLFVSDGWPFAAGSKFILEGSQE